MRSGGIFRRAMQKRHFAMQFHPGFAIEQGIREVRDGRMCGQLAQITGSNHAERPLDFGKRGHPGGQNNRQSKPRHVQQHRSIGQISRTNLQRGDANILYEIRRTVSVEWRRHISNLGGGSGLGDAALVVLAQFECAQHLKLGLPASLRDQLVADLGGDRSRKLIGAKTAEI